MKRVIALLGLCGAVAAAGCQVSREEPIDRSYPRYTPVAAPPAYVHTPAYWQLQPYHEGPTTEPSATANQIPLSPGDVYNSGEAGAIEPAPGMVPDYYVPDYSTPYYYPDYYSNCYPYYYPTYYSSSWPWNCGFGGNSFFTPVFGSGGHHHGDRDHDGDGRHLMHLATPAGNVVRTGAIRGTAAGGGAGFFESRGGRIPSRVETPAFRSAPPVAMHAAPTRSAGPAFHGFSEGGGHASGSGFRGGVGGRR